MVAARIFNEREGQPLPQIYGAVTTGNQWKFLRLSDQTAYVDRRDYYIDQLETLMGILVSLVQPPLPVVTV
jgi:hypothetical protein